MAKSKVEEVTELGPENQQESIEQGEGNEISAVEIALSSSNGRINNCSDIIEKRTHNNKMAKINISASPAHKRIIYDLIRNIPVSVYKKGDCMYWRFRAVLKNTKVLDKIVGEFV